MAQPTDIEFDRARARVTVTWDDGASSVLPASYLRGWCPCAGCQGHGSVVRFLPPSDGPDRELLSIEEVGAYAIGLRFADGHDGGIYRWEWLRRISPQGEPPGYKYGRFVAGAYERSEEDGRA